MKIVPLQLIDLQMFYDSSVRGLMRLCRELRKENYDIAFDLSPRSVGYSGFMRNKLFFKLAKVSSVRGQPSGSDLKSFRDEVLFKLVSKPEWFDVVVRSQSSSVGSGSLRPKRFETLRSLDRSPLNTAEPAMATFGDNIIAVSCGAKWASKRWPSENFFKLCLAILKQKSKIKFVFLGGHEDIATHAEITRNLGKHAIDLTGRLTLSQSAWIIERSRLFIGNDSGLAHVSAFSGVPSVVIMSSQDFDGRWHPHSGKSITVRKKVDCSGCMRATCNRDLVCLERISPEMVLRQALKLIN